MDIKFITCVTTYSIPIDVDVFRTILDKDLEAESHQDCLYTKLNEIDGVIDTDYDGHFGPQIEVSIDAKADNEFTRYAIGQAIKDFVNEIHW